jgi:predicted amidohydrolase
MKIHRKSTEMLKKENRLPREIWAAAISLKGLWPEETIDKRIKAVLQRMESLYPFEPDIICLPETVNISWVNEKKTLAEIAEDEDVPGPVTSVFTAVAKEHNCYIVCPLITKKDGQYFNSSILINRKGKIDGVSHKVHPTSGEIAPDTYYQGGGVTPGALRPPVFKTDFGTVGMQICMDASYYDSWQSLKEDGAEVILFSSQASYKSKLSHFGWLNNYYIISSTGEDARIIDIDGEVISEDGEFARWVCAPINLEKELLHIWPHTLKFDKIRNKYGRDIRFNVSHPENFATIESLHPDIKVKDILREFDIPTYDEHIGEATVIQNRYRL